jgi:hypothetical protein
MGCATTTVRVDKAAEFTATRGARISVLGVFHDGRMSEPAWGTLSPKVSEALGRTFCETGYSQDLRESKPELLASIDHDVRENGIDDALLERISPNAVGDLVMVLMSYRQIPERKTTPTAQQNASPQLMSAGGRMRRGGQSQRYTPPEAEHLFELSASFFSVKLHKLVVQIDLRYEGDDLDEAMDAFTKKLQLTLPEAKCVGWHWVTEPAPPKVEAAPDSN